MVSDVEPIRDLMLFQPLAVGCFTLLIGDNDG